MSSLSQPDLPPAVLSGVKEALGCILLGAVLAAWCVQFHTHCGCYYMLTRARYSVFGITILQVYIYFRNSGPDSPRMKAFVSPKRVLMKSIC